MNHTERINKKFGLKLPFKTDKELYRELKKAGLPSLAKLLKMIRLKK